MRKTATTVSDAFAGKQPLEVKRARIWYQLDGANQNNKKHQDNVINKCTVGPDSVGQDGS